MQARHTNTKEQGPTRSPGRTRSGPKRGRVASLAGLLAMLATLVSMMAFALPAAAATASAYALNLTSPAGSVWMGDDPATPALEGHQWVSDHLFGFCRLDGPAADGTFAINADTCNSAAVSPGQPSFDAANNVVYVPDNSSKSQGVWRLTFNPATQTVGSPVLLGSGSLGVDRASSTALDSAGRLYVSFIKSGNIKRIDAPRTNPGAPAVVIGTSSDGGGVSGIAFVGPDLYLAEETGLTVIADPVTNGCTGCVGNPTDLTVSIGLTAITSNGSDTLYAADTNRVLRYIPSTGAVDLYATQGTLPDSSQVSFAPISSLGLDPAGNLYVADDSSGAEQPLAGRMWFVGTVTAPIHDVAVASISAPSSVSSGATVSVTVTVQNTGNQPESSIAVSLTDNSTNVGSKTISLIPGASQDVTFDWTPSDGSHTLEGAVSSSDDANTSNNTKSTTVNVTAPVHDAAVTGISAPGTAILNVATTVTVTVQNTGNVPESVSVSLTDNTTAVESAKTISLDPGASQDVTFDWTPGSAGSHTLEGAVSSSGDTNVANDKKSATVDVSEASQAFVQDVTLGTQRSGRGTSVVGSVSINSTAGLVANATVSVTLTGPGTNESLTLRTNASGTAEFTAPISRRGTYTLTVTDVTADTYSYTPSLNVESSASISI